VAGNDELHVFLYGRRIGFVTRTDSGLAFEYDGEYQAGARVEAGAPAVPLSLNMPVSGGRYEDGLFASDQVVSNYLRSLLPDDDAVRQAIAQEVGVPADPFSLLGSEVGLDCAGAVQFSRRPQQGGRDSGLTEVSEKAITAMVRGAQQRKAGLLYGRKPRRRGAFSALAGMHAKFALRREGDVWFEAHGDEATSHIIKPDAESSMKNQAFVEHLTMLTAHHAGLRVASTEWMELGGAPSIVVERYDRVPIDGGLLRIHQEDLASAAGYSPSTKYDGVVEDASRVLSAHATNVDAALNSLVDGVIFNAVTGGTDAHIKNYSVLIASGQVRFAPLYDLTSYFPYVEPGADLWDARRGHSVSMSMPVGERHHFGAFTPGDIEAFAADARRDPVEVARRVKTLAEKIPSALDAALASPGLPSSLVRWARSTRLVELVHYCAENAILSADGRPPLRMVQSASMAGSVGPRWTSGANAVASSPMCNKIVASTGLPCLLRKDHGGRCRSR
jgi:serine/threonine-protein kinase HipA